MRVQLSDHFTYPRLLRFTLPSITMMIFTSIYGVVDGLFVSNFVGKTAFAAVNFIMPLLMGMGALGFMVGSGGSALVSRTLGEGDRDKAEGIFSMLVYVTLAVGVALALLGQLFLRPIDERREHALRNRAYLLHHIGDLLGVRHDDFIRLFLPKVSEFL